MKKVISLTESELKEIMHRSVARALVEHNVDIDREIKLAQKTLMKMNPLLSELGLRLEDTKFRLFYQDVKESLLNLNNALIKHIRGEK